MIPPRFARVRITKIVCPSCGGSSKGLFGTCNWCKGERRMSVEQVDKWSHWQFVIADGGYINGDHDLEEMRDIRRDANAARKLAGLEPLK